MSKLWPTWDKFIATGKKYMSKLSAAEKKAGKGFMDNSGTIYAAVLNQGTEKYYKNDGTDGGKLVYSTIFRYELTQPMRPDARGEVLSSNNLVLARRAIGLLRSLVRFGERKLHQPRSVRVGMPRHPMYLVPFQTGCEKIDTAKLLGLTAGMQPGLIQAYAERLQEELCDRTLIPNTTLVNSAIVQDAAIVAALARRQGFEDFSPVLGVPHWNPANGLREMINPASALMLAHGAQGPDDLSQETLEEIVPKFRAAKAFKEAVK